MNAPAYKAVTCHVCRGTGRNPLSDNVNWLPCRTCNGGGNVLVDDAPVSVFPPPVPAEVKLREELETLKAHARQLVAIIEKHQTERYRPALPEVLRLLHELNESRSPGDIAARTHHVINLIHEVPMDILLAASVVKKELER